VFLRKRGEKREESGEGEDKGKECMNVCIVVRGIFIGGYRFILSNYVK
jgi:hypothetical protein